MVSFTEKLVLLVEAFFQGMRTAFWVMILLMLGLYIFAVLGEAIFNHDSAALQAELNARGHEVDLKQHFGSIPKSMVTLIQFFSDDGGISGFQRPVGEIWPWAWLYFIAFLIIVTIG